MFKKTNLYTLSFTSPGSVEAHVVVLLITNENTSKAEIVTYLTEGFDSSFKAEIAISVLIVEGKHTAILFNQEPRFNNFSYLSRFHRLDSQISSCGQLVTVLG